MKFRFLGIAFATVMIAAGAAGAADIAKPVYKAPIVAPAYSWTGFYIGGNAGYSWSNSNAINSTSAAGPCDPAVGGCGAVPNFSQLGALGATGTVGGKLDGFIGGGQAGYNWQVQNWVWGFEADFQWLNASSGGGFATIVATPAFLGNPVTTSFQGSHSLDWLGTARARAGILLTPTILAYATGGLAYGEAKLNGSYRQVCVACNAAVGGLSAAFAASDTLVGWTIGGGAEWLIAPKWTLKAEYLYYDLGDMSVTTLVPGFGFNGLPFIRHSPTVESRFDGQIVRAGLNYKFN
jgi:outer membrane immunogenic protein